MPADSNFYLICSLFWLGIWALLFGCLRAQRPAMLWTGLCLGPAGPISEYWSLQDYWHPAYVFGFRWGACRFGGLEDYILSFALAGICAGLFERHLARRGAGPLPPMRGRLLWRPAGWLTLGLGLFCAGDAAGLHSMDTLILAGMIVAGAMLWKRPELWRPLAGHVAAFAWAYWLFYIWICRPLFPGATEALWKLENTWGVHWAGVPVEEVIWAGLTMLIAGPFLRVCWTPSGARGPAARFCASA